MLHKLRRSAVAWTVTSMVWVWLPVHATTFFIILIPGDKPAALLPTIETGLLYTFKGTVARQYVDNASNLIFRLIYSEHMSTDMNMNFVHACLVFGTRLMKISEWMLAKEIQTTNKQKIYVWWIHKRSESSNIEYTVMYLQTDLILSLKIKLLIFR